MKNFVNLVFGVFCFVYAVSLVPAWADDKQNVKPLRLQSLPADCITIVDVSKKAKYGLGDEIVICVFNPSPCSLCLYVLEESPGRVSLLFPNAKENALLGPKEKRFISRRVTRNAPRGIVKISAVGLRVGAECYVSDAANPPNNSDLLRGIDAAFRYGRVGLTNYDRAYFWVDYPETATVLETVEASPSLF